MRFKISALLMTLVAAFLVVACGGGGGGSSLTTSGVSLFATDDLNTGYDHVFVRIHEIELEHAGGSVKAFESSEGKEVDLRSLNNGSNIFSFLGIGSVPGNTYTGARVTLSKSLVLYTTGSTTGQSVTFIDSLDATAGRSRLNFAFTAPQTVGTGSNLIFDFDLANWTENAGKVTPVVKLFTGGGISVLANQRGEDFKGTVSSLTGTAPNQTFQLSAATTNRFVVSTSASTVFLNSNGNPNPALANGQIVEVRGKFNTSTRVFEASVVKIEDSLDPNEKEVQGATRNANELAGTFEVRSDFVRGFLPTQLWVNVTTDASTRYFSDLGVPISKAAFFAGLAAGSAAEAEGIYTSGTNTLAAYKVKLEDDNGDVGYQEGKGTATNINTSAGTLGISLVEWRGFAGSNGMVLNVSTNGSTTYRSDNGDSMTKEQFFAAISNGSGVKVEGIMQSGVMLAKRLEIRNNIGGGGGGGNDPHEIQGTVSNINEGAGTFTVTLVYWFGFSGTLGAQINVTMSSSATYRDDNGNAISKAQFFAGLMAGNLAEVDGTVSGSSMTGVKGKLDDH
ncbi:DUF5666 domain-containing protein [Kamptonema cortianum]|nr:DUF5666 domain-containing protein [Geitlerinema splendidum]MDK3158787.1 DUF5666 domain-containing protein [Kamptonema cortianum]